MKKYKVTVQYLNLRKDTIIVKANSPEEAEKEVNSYLATDWRIIRIK